MARRKIRVRKKKQNSLAMLLVLMVVFVMMIVVFINSRNLKIKLANYKQREATLSEQIEEEKQRAEEIEEFEKYTKTKKFIEDIAREKLGLVYEDEIIIQTEDD